MAMECDRTTREFSRQELEFMVPEAIAQNESLDFISFILEQGVDSNTKDFQGVPLIQRAIQKGNEPLVGLLLERGADITQVTKDFQRIFLAARPSMQNIVFQAQTNAALLKCAASGNLVGIASALKQGGELLVRDMRGLTIFHIAASGGHSKMLAKLYAAHPDFLCATDKKGYDALYWAIKCGQYETVEWFVTSFPGLIESRDKKYDRAVYWAAAHGFMWLVDWLVDWYPQLAAMIDAEPDQLIRLLLFRKDTAMLQWLAARIEQKELASIQA
jgi:ankyrin repeat protein